MTETSSDASPLEAISAGEQATEAFELLSNETRLAILVSLWETTEPFEEDTAVQFSELRTRVGTPDSGQFNYHLDRLTGHFVTVNDDGYQLTNAGQMFVRSVIAGAGIESPTMEPTTVDMSCTLCGGDVAVAYERGWVLILCTECEGLWQGESDREKGHLAKFSLEPTGLMNRSPAEIYAAAWIQSFQRLYSMIEGVCPTCSGRVERSLAVCDDHESNGTCQHCGRRARTIGRLHCTVCKESHRTTIGGVAKYHPRIVAFCYEHDLELQYEFNDLDHIEDRLRRTETEVEHISESPRRIRVTTKIDDEKTWIELDENLQVVAVAE